MFEYEKNLNNYLKEECGIIEEEILISLSEDEIEYFYDYGCCLVRAVNFSYVDKLHAFFNKHQEKCLEILQQAINDCYIDPQKFEFSRNSIVYLVVEVTVKNFIKYLEDKDNEYLNEYIDVEED